MNKLGGLISSVALVFGILLSNTVCAQSGDQKWEEVWIPSKEKRFFGGIVDIKLQATLYKPAGNGPFPLIVLNHGSTGPGYTPVSQTFRWPDLSQIFLDRGFVVLAPMRKGRGQSEGSYGERYERNFGSGESGMKQGMEDLDSVFAFAKTLSYVDSSRVLISGISRGGILSVVYAAKRQGNVVGVINFVGGWFSDRWSAEAGSFNEHVFRDAGTGAKVKNLWLYAANDSFYSAESIRNFAALFQGSGGKLDLRLYGNVGRNGHSLASYPSVWHADLSSYLESIGFPLSTKH